MTLIVNAKTDVTSIRISEVGVFCTFLTKRKFVESFYDGVTNKSLK